MLKRLKAGSALIFLTAILPMTIWVGVIVYVITRLGGVSGSPDQAVVVAGAVATAALIGHEVAVILTTPLRATLFLERRWLFPLCCGVGVSILAMTGVVENSTDVVGRLVGHFAYEGVVSVGVWSVVVTVALAGVDRVLARVASNAGQIA